jgi:hypothetical protein
MTIVLLLEGTKGSTAGRNAVELMS